MFSHSTQWSSHSHVNAHKQTRISEDNNGLINKPINTLNTQNVAIRKVSCPVHSPNLCSDDNNNESHLGDNSTQENANATVCQITLNGKIFWPTTGTSNSFI